ncbi:chemotaxis protein, partial [Enterobacter hormaechei]
TPVLLRPSAAGANTADANWETF